MGRAQKSEKKKATINFPLQKAFEGRGYTGMHVHVCMQNYS